jgi:hypothetical protein
MGERERRRVEGRTSRSGDEEAKGEGRMEGRGGVDAWR